jgi:hypothetical protein
MGAQILSAGIYFSKRQAGEPVYADLSYFDVPEKVATEGNPGDCSHWGWELMSFGLHQESFEVVPQHLLAQVNMLHDGPRKMELGLEALSQPRVQQQFLVPDSTGDLLPATFAAGYLCIHIRRGDYVNVASHLIADEDFVGIAARFSGLTLRVAVLSDSPISATLRSSVAAHYQEAVFLDSTDAFTAHRVMRGARILVCSNSQFSLIAAMLNTRALVVIPRQWFDGNDRAIEAPLHARCAFQVMSL